MDKIDLSTRAIKDAPAPPRIGGIKRFLVTAGGFQPDWAYEHGTRSDLWNIAIVGCAFAVYPLVWIVSIASGLHVIFDFDGAFGLGLLPIAILIASAQALADHITLVKGPLHDKGVGELKSASLKLPSAERSFGTSRIWRRARKVQGFAFAGLSVMFILLAAEAPGIRSILWADFQKPNAAAFAQATHIVDEAKARDSAALAVVTDEINNLARAIASLRSSSVRQAVVGGRKAAAASAGLDPKIAQLQKQLDAAEIKQAGLRQAVERDDASRNSTIEKLVLSSPQAVPRRTDLGAQIGALVRLIADEPAMLIFAGLLLVVGFSLEIGIMWVAATYLPSALSAKLALEHYSKLTEHRKSGAQQLHVRPDEVGVEPPKDKPPLSNAMPAGESVRSPAQQPVAPFAPSPASRIVSDTPANDNDMPSVRADTMSRAADDNPPAVPGSNGATLPRRPRGRPRKNGLDATSKDAGHE
jgi:hypothetical protein